MSFQRIARWAVVAASAAWIALMVSYVAEAFPAAFGVIVLVAVLALELRRDVRESQRATAMLDLVMSLRRPDKPPGRADRYPSLSSVLASHSLRNPDDCEHGPIVPYGDGMFAVCVRCGDASWPGPNDPYACDDDTATATSPTCTREQEKRSGFSE